MMRALEKLLIVILLLAIVVYVPSTHASSPDSTVVRLQTAAERGSVLSELELAANYMEGKGVTQDLKLAAHWYEVAAQRGDPFAENQIGYFYQSGIGVPVDFARALHWYQLSAASGCVIAKVNLGVMYTRGLGVSKDVGLGIKLFEEAVKKGNGSAAAYLGDIFYLGLAGAPDTVAADKWYGVGIKLHDPVSAFNLGSMFSASPRHSHDFPLAVAYLRRSVDGGYVPAMQSLGLLLINHPEVEQTAYEARSLLESAADAGEWRSSIMLGILARDGTGMAVDRKAALYHFQIAALQGGEEAEALVKVDLSHLSANLKAHEYMAVLTAADEWYAKHRLPQTFISQNGKINKYFPVPMDTNIEKDASVTKASQPAS